MQDVMVDCETLGTIADSVIMSIGAVRFDLDSDQIDDAGFYASISIDSNIEWKRRVQEDTLLWWLKQPLAAQSVFHEPKQTLESALIELSDWFDGDGVRVWSNGADFDVAMLAHAFKQVGVEVPWRFWNVRCVRTYKNLPQAKTVSVKREGTHHNALADAVYQAKLVRAIHRMLTPQARAQTA